jgi:hypothetical protein
LPAPGAPAIPRIARVPLSARRFAREINSEYTAPP